MKAYVRPAEGQWQAELEIKRSRFIGLVKCTPTESAAREFIHQVRGHYPDARHHCSAYVVEQQDAQNILRSSDDGEPAGTAGQPMLEVLRGFGVSDVTAVVVRYFGGTLLGTGGLVRAYQDTTKAALEQVKWVRREPVEVQQIVLGHGEAGKIEAELRHAGYQVLEVDYGAQVSLRIAGDEQLAGLVSQLTGGKVEPIAVGSRWVCIPTRLP